MRLRFINTFEPDHHVCWNVGGENNFKATGGEIFVFATENLPENLNVKNYNRNTIVPMRMRRFNDFSKHWINFFEICDFKQTIFIYIDVRMGLWSLENFIIKNPCIRMSIFQRRKHLIRTLRNLNYGEHSYIRSQQFIKISKQSLKNHLVWGRDRWKMLLLNRFCIRI